MHGIAPTKLYHSCNAGRKFLLNVTNLLLTLGNKRLFNLYYFDQSNFLFFH